MRDRVRLYEITEAAADEEARSLTTPEKINARLGAAPTADAEMLAAIIDQVSTRCAQLAGIAAPPNGGIVPTFGRETIKVTWLRASCETRHTLYLPWRVPIVEIESITEDGAELEDTDYHVIGAGGLMRVYSDEPTCWSAGKIVAQLTVGWELPDEVPPDLEGAVIEQVKMMYLGRKNDPALRSEDFDGLWSATYAVPGGDSIEKNGLLFSLCRALDRYSLKGFA